MRRRDASRHFRNKKKAYLRAKIKIEKNEMGGACGAHGGGESCVQGYAGET